MRITHHVKEVRSYNLALQTVNAYSSRNFAITPDLPLNARSPKITSIIPNIIVIDNTTNTGIQEHLFSVYLLVPNNVIQNFNVTASAGLAAVGFKSGQPINVDIQITGADLNICLVNLSAAIQNITVFCTLNIEYDI